MGGDSTAPVRTLALAKDLSAAIRDGHPWVFQRALVSAKGAAPRAGELVRLSFGGAPIAVGYADPGSPIAVRVLARDPDTVIDEPWFRTRLRDALSVRELEPSLAQTNAMRLVHGEADELPGLVVDRYDQWGVVRFDGAGAQALWRPWLPMVREELGLAGLWDRAAQASSGTPPPQEIVIDEAGAKFFVDVRRGQKTGFFLDQRPNRIELRTRAAGVEVLNLFCYTGGFSVHAALGGATRVTSVDSAQPAITQACRTFELNGLDRSQHPLEVADVFAFLDRAATQGRTWDVVVCDPPSFAPSERARPQALRAYRKLNRQVLSVVAPGGLLVTASCSSHVTDADLLAAVAGAAAEAGRSARVVSVTGPGVDHPLRPGFPEGRYLKCLWTRVQ